MKYPFTESGVEDLLNSLYALPDTELELEAVEIELDFKGWMETHVDLSAEQILFMDGIKEEAINYYGSQCALCFRHRLEIKLIYPTPPTTPGYAKFPDTSNDIRIITDSNGGMTVTGSLTFTMVYQET